MRRAATESAGTSVAVLSWGAAPASDTLLRNMAELFPGAQIYAAFGQTEMLPVTCMLLAQDAIRKLGSVGKVIPTVAAVHTDLDLGDLDEFLTERLARYKHPKALEMVEALPRNPAGKVLKTELRARFCAQGLIDAGETSTPPTVSAAVQDI